MINEHDMTEVPMTENQLGEKQTMEKVAEHVGMNYPETPDSKYVAQPSTIFSFHGPITVEEDEGFSELRTPVSEPPGQPPMLETRTALRFLENLQNSSAAQQFFDL